MSIESIKSKNGKTYWIESGDTLYSQRLKSGQYQSTNWQFAQKILPQFRNCLDIGSNNAVNAIHYAELFDWVYCYEPTPLAQQLWTNTVRDNSVTNVTLITDALGETKSTSEILIHPRNGGHNHLAHWNINPRADRTRSSKQTVTVQVNTVDSYGYTDVDFIKIDVEGYEQFVLKGAEQTIKNNRPLLQLEIVGSQCRKFNYTAESMIEWIRNRNYRVVSKRDGWLDGDFETVKGNIHYNGQRRRGDMDLFFVPCEWNIQLEPSKELFEVE